MTGPDGGSGDLTIDVRRGAPTEDELAALLAVVSEAYTVEAAHATVSDADAGRTAWSVTQRGLRTPLRRELGWGRFSG
ncbi:MAG: acyl-CoA carboxylase subunit epsilon [Microbacterium sp.]